MACMTLKRSLDFDPVHNADQRTPKRRRYMPLSSHCASNSRSTEKRSYFNELSTKLTQEQIAEHLREEMRRLFKRKQLASSSSQSNQSQSENEDTISPPSSPSATTPDGVSLKRDQPLFTFRQVGIICERLLKEQETQIKSEYDKALSYKLAEQYDTFVKFTHDQIHKRFEGATASYLS